MPSAAASIPQTESPSNALQELIQMFSPNHDKEQIEDASSSNEQDVSKSRSGSREPGTAPDVCEVSEGSDVEAGSSSPVKQKSPSPTDCRKLRSTSSPRRSASKSKSRRRQSRFVVCVNVYMCPSHISNPSSLEFVKRLLLRPYKIRRERHLIADPMLSQLCRCN